MKINKELNLIDLIKIGVLVLSGVIGYCLVDHVSAKNDQLLLQKQFLDALPDFYPNLRTNYTNEFNATGDSLYIKVYLENRSKYPIWIDYPIVKLLNVKEENRGDYITINRDQLRGLISPGSSFQLTYINQADSAFHKFASVNFKVEVDISIKSMYGCLFEEVLDDLDAEAFDRITTKDYNYQEKTYSYNTNPIWDNFFENPR